MGASIGGYTGCWEDVLTLVDWLAGQLAPVLGEIDDTAWDRDDYRHELLLVAMNAALAFRRRHQGTFTDEKRYIARSLWNRYRNWAVRRWHGYTRLSLDDFLTFESEGVRYEGYLEARDALHCLETMMPSKRLETLVAWELDFGRPADRRERQRLRTSASRARAEARALL